MQGKADLPIWLTTARNYFISKKSEKAEKGRLELINALKVNNLLGLHLKQKIVENGFASLLTSIHHSLLDLKKILKSGKTIDKDAIFCLYRANTYLSKTLKINYILGMHFE